MPNSAPFFCGPLAVTVDAALPILREKVLETLRLYDRVWESHDCYVSLRVGGEPGTALPAHGTFLRCARMDVDRAGDGLRATTIGGARAMLRRDGPNEVWDLHIPDALLDTTLEDVEELVILALTSGWRSAGWVPVHTAAVARDARCIMICAPSGGGKSTLTAAFVRRGWHAVGDDKVLLRMRDGIAQIAALQRTFNLHPQTSAWFPEVGDLEALPLYSRWTPKRKVKIDSIWANPAADVATPTHLFRIRRSGLPGPIAIEALSPAETLSTLLRQVAIPTDRTTANAILASAVPAAQRMRGFEVVIGENVYERSDALDALEAAIS